MTDTVGYQEWRAPARAGLLARLRATFDAEQEQWFLWVPVMLGIGIAGYFAMPVEPTLWMTALVLAVAAGAHWSARSRGHWSLPILHRAGSVLLQAVLRSAFIRAAITGHRAMTLPTSGPLGRP